MGCRSRDQVDLPSASHFATHKPLEKSSITSLAPSDSTTLTKYERSIVNRPFDSHTRQNSKNEDFFISLSSFSKMVGNRLVTCVV